MSRHTPGPWNLGQTSNDAEAFSIYREDPIKQVGWIANSWDDKEREEYVSEEDLANAGSYQKPQRSTNFSGRHSAPLITTKRIDGTHSAMKLREVSSCWISETGSGRLSDTLGGGE